MHRGSIVILVFFFVLATFTHAQDKKRTPTENFISVIDLETIFKHFLVEKETQDKIKNFIIHTIIPQEKKHQKSYEVLYHGTERWFWLLFELQRQLHTLTTQEESNFTFLRAKGDFHNKNESIDSFLKRYHYNIGDQAAPMRRILLSTNLSFPGNMNFGESSFYYTLGSSSIFPPSIHAMFFGLLHSFLGKNRLKKREQQKIMDLVTILEKTAADLTKDPQLEYGLLLQIFIPKNIATEIVYISDFGGWVKHRGEKQSEYTKSIFKLAKTSIEKQQLKSLQARILLRDDIFTDPESGIKINEYLFGNLKQLKKYKNQIKKTAQVIYKLKAEISSDQNKKDNSNEANSEIQSAYSKSYLDYFLKSVEDGSRLITQADKKNFKHIIYFYNPKINKFIKYTRALLHYKDLKLISQKYAEKLVKEKILKTIDRLKYTHLLAPSDLKSILSTCVFLLTSSLGEKQDLATTVEHSLLLAHSYLDKDINIGQRESLILDYKDLFDLAVQRNMLSSNTNEKIKYFLKKKPLHQ